MRPRRGFTLIELMVVVAVVAVVLMMAAPAFRDMIIKQRLQGTADQFMTDVQFARTEAASRQTITRLRFKTVTGMTCYIVHTCSPSATSACSCDCTAAAGSRCSNPEDKEIRTVQLNAAQSIALFPVKNDGNSAVDANIAFDPATGGVTSYFPPLLFGPGPPAGGALWVKIGRIGTPGAAIRTIVNTTGRAQACAQGGSISGMSAC